MWWFVLLMLPLLPISSLGVSDHYCFKNPPIRLTSAVGTITTPNFPHKFSTPYCQRWVIDSGPVDSANLKILHIYFTQPYFRRMFEPDFHVRFHIYPPFNDTIHQPVIRSPLADNRIAKIKSRPKRAFPGQEPMESHPHNKTHPLKADEYGVYRRYISIEARIETLDNTMFRADGGYLHVFGFNITYEINNSSTTRQKTCTIYSCRGSGNCYATADYTSFYCACQEGRYGDHCEHSLLCDPAKGINPCFNGGRCETLAAGSVACFCRPGYIGLDCSRRNSTFIKAVVCPGPDCPQTCDKSSPEAPPRPCSCHNSPRRTPPGWIRYQVEVETNWTDTTSENWTTLEDEEEQQQKFKHEIELRLTERLRKVEGLEEMENVTILAFSPTSIQFQFYEPPEASNKTQQVLEELKGEELVPGIVILDAPFGLRAIPPLQLQGVIMKPGGKIRENDNFSITCSAIGSSNITFKWFKDDLPVDPSFATWGRIREMVDRSEDSYESLSTLNFDKADVNDRGIFTCQVSDDEDEQCKDFEMDVLGKPILHVNKLSLTLVKNTADTVITCGAAFDDGINQTYDYDWAVNNTLIGYRHGDEIKEDLFPRGSLLLIKRAQMSKTYTCIVNNSAGEETIEVHVAVLDSKNSPHCPAQMIDVDGSTTLSWDMTAPNQTAKRDCPDAYSGFLQRTCEWRRGIPFWGDPDFSNCYSIKLGSISRMVQHAKLGYTSKFHLFQMLWDLAAYMKDKNGFVYLGEGERIIDILKDIGNYTMAAGNKPDTVFFEHFLNTTTKFLSFRESCFHEKSVISLCNLIHRMAANYSSSSGFSYQSDAMMIQGPESTNSSSLVFSSEIQTFPPWLKFHLEIPNNKVKANAKFLIVVLRNLTFPVTQRESHDVGFNLISPVVFINSTNYVFYNKKPMVLRFNLSEEFLKKKLVNVTCGGLDDDPEKSMDWNRNACHLSEFTNDFVECHCARFGQFGILAESIEHEVPKKPVPSHWFVLFGCIVCILCCTLALVSLFLYTHCRLLTNSLYLLKIIDCSSLILSILFALSAKANSSSILLSTILGTFLLISFATQLTKSVRVFISATRLDLDWLRTVPLLNLTSGITFACVLPLWTCAAAVLHSQSDTSALEEHSPFFAVFVGSLILIIAMFTGIYYKGILLLKKNRRMMESEKLHTLDYRVRTLNRAFAITTSTMIMTLFAIIHINANPESSFQYFFGLSAIVTGFTVLLSYTVYSEYPLPSFITQYCICLLHQPDYPDPEKPLQRVQTRTPEKRYSTQPVSSILLQSHRRSTSGSRHSSEPETTMETLAGSSICSATAAAGALAKMASTKQVRASSTASSMKRPSFGSSTSSKIPRSLTNPPTLHNHVNPERRDRFPMRSEWHNLSTNGLMNGAIMPMDRPQRGKCLLVCDSTTHVHVPPAINPPLPSHLTNGISGFSKKDIGDYVSPSIRPNEQNIEHKTVFHPKRRLNVEMDVFPPSPSSSDGFGPSPSSVTTAFLSLSNSSSQDGQDYVSYNNPSGSIPKTTMTKTEDLIRTHLSNREHPLTHAQLPLANGHVSGA